MDGSSTESGKPVLILTPGFPANENDYNCLPSVQGFVFELAKQLGNENVFVFKESSAK